jgi:uncharacterized protein (TIGR03083 family)
MTMIGTDPIDVPTIEPIGHAEGMALFGAELERTIELLRTLSPDQWQMQTDCPDWDVRRLQLHVLGACEAGASMRENLHQMRAGRAHQKANGGPLEAGLSAVQVDERLDLTPDELVDRLATVAPVTVRKRTKMPAVLRKAKMKVDGPVVEKWSLGYLIDIIYLRDAWMHRIDVCRATGAELVLDATHDGRIVADVVGEWARRHGRPFTLVLTGPAGATFTAGTDGDAPTIEMDAIEFCRTLAGRSSGTGLLATVVPF